MVTARISRVIGTAPNDRAGLYGRNAVIESGPQSRQGGGEVRPTGRVTIADELQAALVELLDLSLIVKQLSWNVSGPGADEFRAQLDLLSSWLRHRVDAIATRALALGHVPNGQSRAVAIETSLMPVPARELTVDEARYALHERIQDVCAQLMDAGKSDRGDRPAAELLVGLTAGLERQRAAITPAPG